MGVGGGSFVTHFIELSKIVADNILNFLFVIFGENKTWHFL